LIFSKKTPRPPKIDFGDLLSALKEEAFSELNTVKPCPFERAEVLRG